ncbi:hypothetical protein DA792_10920 [Celeribacter baekdonensis]|uniref:Uncharacterized protein n=1 Tax=Celeribacter baekdonensis TaxID=875171 RepID=A0A2R4M2Y4_9RHOB|nr:hypothetical protein DA792_10920 [Celeribacter baekdonensis]
MLRFVFSILFLTQALAPTLASACEKAPYYAETREAIDGHDIERVEQILNDSQDLFDAGRRSADDLRCLFGQFENAPVHDFLYRGLACGLPDLGLCADGAGL